MKTALFKAKLEAFRLLEQKQQLNELVPQWMGGSGITNLNDVRSAYQKGKDFVQRNVKIGTPNLNPLNADHPTSINKDNPQRTVGTGGNTRYVGPQKTQSTIGSNSNLGNQETSSMNKSQPTQHFSSTNATNLNNTPTSEILKSRTQQSTLSTDANTGKLPDSPINQTQTKEPSINTGSTNPPSDPSPSYSSAPRQSSYSSGSSRPQLGHTAPAGMSTGDLIQNKLAGNLEEETLLETRIKIIKARIRGGKIQRRKRVSNVPGMTLRGGRLKRMSPTERRNRRMGQKRGKMKRRAKLARTLQKRKRSLMKRKVLGLG